MIPLGGQLAKPWALKEPALPSRFFRMYGGFRISSLLVSRLAPTYLPPQGIGAMHNFNEFEIQHTALPWSCKSLFWGLARPVPVYRDKDRERGPVYRYTDPLLVGLRAIVIRYISRHAGLPVYRDINRGKDQLNQALTGLRPVYQSSGIPVETRYHSQNLQKASCR